MKKCIVAILLPLFLLILGVKLAQAQKWNEKEVTVNQPSASVSLSLAYRIYATVGGQMFTCKVKNLTKSKINITFDLVAYTLCGNTVSKHIDVDLDPAEGAGNSGILDNTYDGQVKSSDCAGTKFRYHSQDLNMDVDGTNRINTLGYQNFVVKIYPPAIVATKGKTATSAATNAGLGPDKADAVNAPSTSGNINTTAMPYTPAMATTGTQTMQQAQYQNKANNYVDAAQSSTNDINKAMNLNIAKVNAQAAGNTAQVQQIQKMQNEQQAAQNDAIVNILKDFIQDRINVRKPDKKAEALSAYNTALRRFLYEATENYSKWYFGREMTLLAHDDSPDLLSYSKNDLLNAIQQAYSKKDGAQLVDMLLLASPGDADDATDMPPEVFFSYEDFPEVKAMQKATKDAFAGKMKGLLEMLHYYSGTIGRGGEVDAEKLKLGELFFQKFLADKQYKTVPKKKTKTLTQAVYMLRANMYLNTLDAFQRTIISGRAVFEYG